MPEHRTGHVIGNYRLIRLLGQGGVGSVYEVEHIRLGRKKAMKLLHAEVTPELVTRFFNEARAVNAIKHPNVVDIEDFVTTETGESFTIMDLLVGEDLRGALSREKRFAPERVAMIGAQLAEALAAVHAHGIIHRDLKPENIFLVQRDGKETAKLLDFGVAKFVNETQGLTRADMTMGTPNYMAPEQIISGRQVGTESDLYSVGMVLYECLTGAAAFANLPRAGVLRAHCFTAPKTPSEVRGEPVPPVLESIVLRCLEKAPDDRFANATELAHAFGAETPVEIPSKTARQPRVAAIEPAPVAPAPKPRRRLLQVIPAVGLLVAAIVVLAWPHGGDAGPPSPVVVRPTAPPPRPAPLQDPPAPKPTTFRLALVSQPTGAQMFVGPERTPVGTSPITIDLALGVTPVAIVAHFADGRETTQTIVPDRPRPELAFAAPPVKKPIPPKPPISKTKTPDPRDRDATLDPFKK